MTGEDTPYIRKRATRRQFALRTYHPDVGRVDAETFWVIWRDGANDALSTSAKLSELHREVGQQILLMAQARDAAPAVCPHCGVVLED